MKTHSRLLSGVLCASMAAVSLYTFSANPAAQTTACTAAPAATSSTTMTVSRGDAESAADITIAWAPVEGTNGATSYVIEAGTARGLSDVANFDTGSTYNWWVQPAAVGTYYVRVKAKNACGVSAPSWEWEVPVTASTPVGRPVARIYEQSTTFTRDEFGDAVVFGEVRSAWGSGVASLITLNASFRGSNGEELTNESVYLDGRSRRLRRSGETTDTTLAGGENGCFRIPGLMPRSNISSMRLSLSFEELPTDNLNSRVELTGPVVRDRSSSGELQVSGQVVNRGPAVTFWNKAVVDVRDTSDKVIGCEYVYVDGTLYRRPDGSAVSGLQPSQTGSFRLYSTMPAAPVARVGAYIHYDEGEATSAGEASEDPAVSWLRRAIRTLERGPRGLATAGERQRLRSALNDRLRAKELALAAGN